MKKNYSNEGTMSHESRIAVLENTIGHIHEALERIDKRFDKIDERFDKVDERFDKVDERFLKVYEEMRGLRSDVSQDVRDLNNRLWFNFFWTVAGFGGVLTLIARSFH